MALVSQVQTPVTLHVYSNHTTPENSTYFGQINGIAVSHASTAYRCCVQGVSV